MKELSRVIGQGNTGKVQQFLQVVATGVAATVDFWAFTAVDGDAVLSQLTNIDGTSGLGYLGAGATAYQNILYTGSFTAIKLASGKVKLEFSEQ